MAFRGLFRADSRRRSAGFLTGLNATTWLRSKPIGNRRSVIAAQRVSVFLNPPRGLFFLNFFELKSLKTVV
jgi:hypothetical protein